MDFLVKRATVILGLTCWFLTMKTWVGRLGRKYLTDNLDELQTYIAAVVEEHKSAAQIYLTEAAKPIIQKFLKENEEEIERVAIAAIRKKFWQKVGKTWEWLNEDRWRLYCFTALTAFACGTLITGIVKSAYAFTSILVSCTLAPGKFVYNLLAANANEVGQDPEIAGMA